jgi:hypothetical protein
VKDFPLYHWSPTARRASIRRLGLVPGRKSLCGQWRPPYVCFSDTPSMAWALSPMHHPEIESWDLWQTWANEIAPYEWLRSMREVRAYHRVMKSCLWFAGSRGNNEPR